MYYELLSKEIAKQEGGCVREVEQGCFKKAGTIKELANQLGVDAQVLEETVNNYNKMMRSGEDAEWGRKTGLGVVIKTPFYAVKTVPATCDTEGGLTINQPAEVLDVWKQPITGLYAAGSTTAGWRGEIYQGSGTAISIAVTFERLAGEEFLRRQ